MSLEPVHEEDHNGFKLQIHYDDDPINPRKDWDPFGTMVCWHRRYDLGDDHNYASPYDFELALSGLSTKSDPTSEQIATAIEKRAVILPLFLYDHSGITMNTTGFSCPWDSGRVGYIYATLEDIREEFKVQRVSAKLRRRVEEMLRQEVSTYDEYLTGQVYGFEIRDLDDEVIDSCWGFYGGQGYCLEEARRSVPEVRS